MTKEKALLDFLRSLPLHGVVRGLPSARGKRVRPGAPPPTFWYLDMPPEWQHSKSTILDLLKDLHRDDGQVLLLEPQDSPARLHRLGQGALRPWAQFGVTPGAFASVRPGACDVHPEPSPYADIGVRAAAAYHANVPPALPRGPPAGLQLPGPLAASDPAADPGDSPADVVDVPNCCFPYSERLRRSEKRLKHALALKRIAHGPMCFYEPPHLHASLREQETEGSLVRLRITGFRTREQPRLGRPSIMLDNTYHARRFQVDLIPEPEQDYLRIKGRRGQELHITIGYYGTKRILSAEDDSVGVE